jgi:HAD superfamily hydrolase (TIGR01509 family)
MKEQDMALSAVLFDMDGLLVDTEPAWMRAERILVAELGGQSWGEDDQRAILGLSLPLAIGYIQQRTGSAASVEEIGDRLVDLFLVELGGGRIPMQPGAAELVIEVADAGVPFALVSASVRRIMTMVMAHMAAQGLPAFPVSIAGDEVPRGKPDPMPYLRAAALLGIPIEHAVVLEDSPNGVQAGWSAGATVVAVEAMVPHEPRDRVVVRPSLAGLRLADLRAMAS